MPDTNSTSLRHLASKAGGEAVGETLADPTFGSRVQRFWRDETALRARLMNVGHLLTGNLFSSVIGILGFLVTARALGATDYGVLALHTAIRGW